MPKIGVANLNDMYKRIEDLCCQKGVNITQMCKESGAARGALTDLKMGRTNVLGTATLAKLAPYFNVSMDYLLGIETKKEPVPISENELDLRLIEMLTSLTPDEMRQVDAFVQGLLAARKA